MSDEADYRIEKMQNGQWSTDTARNKLIKGANMAVAFKKAERKKIKMKLAIQGPSGAGKTFSALRLAKGLGGKVAVIDTENGSASLYSDKFEFDSLELSPPYSTDKYIDAINAAASAGYNVLVIDSVSHQWAGEGGLLNKKEQLDARGGNSFANWAKMTPEHEKFKAAILHSDIHVVATIRSKQEYVLSENDKGKTAPKKVGMAPVQREGMEYEFTTVFEVAMNHEAHASKDRTGLFTDKVFQVTEKTGEELNAWLGSAQAEAATPPKQETKNVARTEARNKLVEICGRHAMTGDQIANEILAQTGKEGKDLTDEEYVGMVNNFESKLRVNREFDKSEAT